MITTSEIEEFFKEKKIIYLPHLTFDKDLEPIIRKKCNLAYKKKQLDMSIQWLGKYYGKEFEDKLFPKVYIDWIDQRLGYGVFALEDLPAFTFLGEYTGIMRKRPLLFHKSNDYCFGYEIGIGHKTRYYIDAERAGNVTRFINHGKKTNAEPLALYRSGLIHIIIRTSKTISKGEQILYDYGETYWAKRYDKTPL
jgi:hypothetical protein